MRQKQFLHIRSHLSFQRGISLTGLILVLAVLGVAAVVALKLVPTYTEYSAVKDAIVRAKEAGGTVREMQVAFDKNAGINSVTAIRGRDLTITREDGEVQLSFAYEKRVPLTSNVSLLIDYAGTTDPSGVVAAKDGEAAPK
jgi:type II secretory pathway pseudopilin PulG